MSPSLLLGCARQAGGSGGRSCDSALERLVCRVLPLFAPERSGLGSGLGLRLGLGLGLVLVLVLGMVLASSNVVVVVVVLSGVPLSTFETSCAGRNATERNKRWSEHLRRPAAPSSFLELATGIWQLATGSWQPTGNQLAADWRLSGNWQLAIVGNW